MTRGRKSEPTRKRRGTGHRPQAGEAKVTVLRQVVPEVELPPPPPSLKGVAVELWNVAIAELAHRGLKEVDLEAIKLMCQSARRAEQAAENIEHFGTLVQGARGPMVNPMLRVERDSTMTYLRLAEQFGLTFASRLRLGLMQLAGESILHALDQDLDDVGIALPARTTGRGKSKRK